MLTRINSNFSETELIHTSYATFTAKSRVTVEYKAL